MRETDGADKVHKRGPTCGLIFPVLLQQSTDGFSFMSPTIYLLFLMKGLGGRKGLLNTPKYASMR